MVKKLERYWKGWEMATWQGNIELRLTHAWLKKGVKLPDGLNACYACYIKKEYNVVTPGICKKHTLATHPKL